MDNSQAHDAMRQNRAAEAKDMAAKGYLTAQEAAERSGRGLATIYRWLRRKDSCSACHGRRIAGPAYDKSADRQRMRCLQCNHSWDPPVLDGIETGAEGTLQRRWVTRQSLEAVLAKAEPQQQPQAKASRGRKAS